MPSGFYRRSSQGRRLDLIVIPMQGIATANHIITRYQVLICRRARLCMNNSGLECSDGSANAALLSCGRRVRPSKNARPLERPNRSSIEKPPLDVGKLERQPLSMPRVCLHTSARYDVGGQHRSSLFLRYIPSWKFEQP